MKKHKIFKQRKQKELEEENSDIEEESEKAEE